jgi:hypothetical protein
MPNADQRRTIEPADFGFRAQQKARRGERELTSLEVYDSLGRRRVIASSVLRALATCTAVGIGVTAVK